MKTVVSILRQFLLFSLLFTSWNAWESLRQSRRYIGVPRMVHQHCVFALLSSVNFCAIFRRISEVWGNKQAWDLEKCLIELSSITQPHWAEVLPPSVINENVTLLFWKLAWALFTIILIMLPKVRTILSMLAVTLWIEHGEELIYTRLQRPWSRHR